MTQGATISERLTAALRLPNGARFYQCALQVNPFAYLSRYGKSTMFSDEAAYNKAIIETCFELAKDELGLDHCEARSWHGFHRHVTLVMAASAFLAKLRADLLRSAVTQEQPIKRNQRSPVHALAS